MKKNFSIKSVDNKVQVSTAKQEVNNLLNFVMFTECCPWAVAMVGNAATQKSLILR